MLCVIFYLRKIIHTSLAQLNVLHVYHTRNKLFSVNGKRLLMKPLLVSEKPSLAFNNIMKQVKVF